MKFIPTGVTRTVAKQILVAKKNSPHIFFVGGVVGVVASAVMACKATLDLEDALDEIKEDIKEVKSLREDKDLPASNYDQREYVRDLVWVYGKSGRRLGRLYGPSIVIGGVSIAALTGSHIQMTRRNAALTATLGALSKAYDEYRERVRQELGEERERELYLNVGDHENANGEVVKAVGDPNKYSIYAVIFDESNPNWRKDAELNRIFLQAVQNYCNHKLQVKGHLFLNEVYDSLGFEHTSAGAICGWVVNGDGDNYVDFGMFETRSARFINNEERSVVLDFNVDGPIWNKI